MKGKKFFIKTILLIFFCTNDSFAEIKNKILVTVNDTPITTVDLINEIKLVNITSGGKLSQLDEKTIESYGIKSLVNKTIKQNELTKYNIPDVSEYNINLEIKQIENKLNISGKNIKKIFEEQKLPYSFLQRKVNLDLKWNQLMFSFYKDRISISEVEVNEKLNELKEKLNITEYNLSEIVLKPMNKKQLELEEKKIINEIKKNGFEKTALKYSIANSASRNGKLGWLKETQISKKIIKLIETLPINGVTKPIILPEGIIFMKINNKRIIKNKVDLVKAKKNIITNQTEKKLNFFSILHFQKLKNISSISFK